MVRSLGRVEPKASGGSDARGPVVVLDASRPMPDLDLARLKRWLGVRVPGSAVEVFVGKAAP